MSICAYVGIPGIHPSNFGYQTCIQNTYEATHFVRECMPVYAIGIHTCP